MKGLTLEKVRVEDQAAKTAIIKDKCFVLKKISDNKRAKRFELTGGG